MDNWIKCGHCGYMHDGVCPRLKSISYYENGMIKKIEYHGPNEPNEPNEPQYDDEEAAMPF